MEMQGCTPPSSLAQATAFPRTVKPKTTLEKCVLATTSTAPTVPDTLKDSTVCFIDVDINQISKQIEVLSLEMPDSLGLHLMVADGPQGTVSKDTILKAL